MRGWSYRTNQCCGCTSTSVGGPRPPAHPNDWVSPGPARLSLIYGMPRNGSVPRLAPRSATDCLGRRSGGGLMRMTQVVADVLTPEALARAIPRPRSVSGTSLVPAAPAAASHVVPPTVVPPTPLERWTTSGPHPVWPAVVLDLALSLALAADDVGLGPVAARGCGRDRRRLAVAAGGIGPLSPPGAGPGPRRSEHGARHGGPAIHRSRPGRGAVARGGEPRRARQLGGRPHRSERRTLPRRRQATAAAHRARRPPPRRARASRGAERHRYARGRRSLPHEVGEGAAG